MHAPFTPRLQVAADNVPPAGLALHVTVPVGVVDVPPEVSFTVAVHVVTCPMPSGLGVHAIAVSVERRVTVNAYVPELGR